MTGRMRGIIAAMLLAVGGLSGFVAAETAVVTSGSNATVAASTAAPVSPFGDKLIAEARKELAEVKTTKYEHTIEINEATGAFVTDCSGLVCWLMKKVAPEQLNAIQVVAKRRHALAEDFYTAMSGGEGKKGWMEIKSISDALPGDVLAYRFEKPRTNTGHVVIIDGKAVKDEDKLWHVRVIDATSKTHAEDTRAEGVTGVGAGVMWFVTDATGHPTALMRKSPKETPSEEPIAIGRIVPMQ